MPKHIRRLSGAETGGEGADKLYMVINNDYIV